MGVLDKMSHRTKYKDGKLSGWIPAGRRAPDYETIFPDSLKMPEDMRDEYGNLCYELVNPGKPDARFERVDVEPAEEQKSKVRSREIIREMEKAGYDINREIALVKDAIAAVAEGEDLPNEYVEMEAVRQNIKTKVKDNGAVQRDLQAEI